MFELGQLVLHLDGELSSRRDHDSLDPVCSKKVPLAQIFSERQTECQGLTATSEITGNHILSVVNRVEAVLLDGEHVLDASGDELRGRRCMDLGEARELIVRDSVGFESLRSAFLTSQADLVVGVVATSIATLVLFSAAASSSCSSTYEQRRMLGK